jgi:molybdopterin-guanine dinucleotide biosynthesis protein A
MSLDCTALILCGGRSSRMGQDKTMLELGGQTMLARAVAFWKPLCRAVLLAAGQEGHFAEIPAGAVQVFDRYPGCGPLGGVHAGLLAAETDYVIVSAVDMPFLDDDAARRLLDACQGHDACIFQKDGRPEPLFGVYRRTCAPVAETLLQEGLFRMGALLQRVDTVRLDNAPEAVFFNVNTPDAFQEARQQLEGQP